MLRQGLLSGASPLALVAEPCLAPAVADFQIAGRSAAGELKLPVGGQVLRVRLPAGLSPAQTVQRIIDAASHRPAIAAELKVNAMGTAVVRLSLRDRAAA